MNGSSGGDAATAPEAIVKIVNKINPIADDSLTVTALMGFLVCLNSYPKLALIALVLELIMVLSASQYPILWKYNFSVMGDGLSNIIMGHCHGRTGLFSEQRKDEFHLMWIYRILLKPVFVFMSNAI